MSLRTELEELIKEHKEEIIQDGDWFYALDNYELNVHDYYEEGIFTASLSPRRGCVTDWSRIIHLPSLGFSIDLNGVV
jgi:hypothetical protein